MNLDEIRQLVRAENFQGALELLDRHLAEHPSNRNLLFEKADVQFRLGEFRDAFKIINGIAEPFVS